jgi:quinol-cytochrome oxidoreductase complex cytochrome b subunit
MKKVIGLGAIGGFIFGILALIFGITIFGVILVLGSILILVGLLLYYIRAVTINVFDGIRKKLKRSK